MKKFIAFVLTFVLVLSLSATTVLADAIGDWNQGTEASYDVEVTAPDGYVNIRTGPGTGYDVISQLYNGEVVRILYESDDGRWGQIVFNTREFGWIALSQTTRTSGSESTPTPASTPTAQSVYNGGSSCNYQVIVSAPDGGVNLRFGPSTDYDIRVSMIPNDTILQVTAKEGRWGRTTYNGTDGWIALSQVSEYVPLEVEEEVEVEPTPGAEPTQTVEALPAPQVSEAVDTDRDESDVVQQLQMQQQQNQAAEAEGKMGFMGKLILIGVIVLAIIIAAIVLLCVWMKKTNRTELFEDYGDPVQEDMDYTPQWQETYAPELYADEEYAQEEYVEPVLQETEPEQVQDVQAYAEQEVPSVQSEEASQQSAEETVPEETQKQVTVSEQKDEKRSLKDGQKDIKNKF
ncbi:MAG: SH3 domain-containing protein [Clostridia bacterium]|nr:SH3 domain-containing protein [Clostridia bacterium]